MRERPELGSPATGSTRAGIQDAGELVVAVVADEACSEHWRSGFSGSFCEWRRHDAHFDEFEAEVGDPLQ